MFGVAMNFVLHHLVINGSVLVLYYIGFSIFTCLISEHYYRYQIRRVIKTVFLLYLSWSTWQLEPLAVIEGVVMHLKVTSLLLFILAIGPIMKFLVEREKHKEDQERLVRNNHY